MYLEELREFNRLYNMGDRIYSVFARSCGISECAYWMMYDVTAAGGYVTLHSLATEWSYSKQTINSAVKTLREKGLLELEYVEGSRKNKAVRFTSAGNRFVEQYISPAMDAEVAAMKSLPKEDKEALLRVFRTYIERLGAEFARTQSAKPDAGAGEP